MLDELAFVAWTTFVTIIPGAVILILGFYKHSQTVERDSLLHSVLLSISLSYVFVAMTGYFLDFSLGVSWFNFLIVTLVLIGVLVYFQKSRLVQLIHDSIKKVRDCCEFKAHGLSIVTVAGVALFVLLPSLRSMYLYPSDPLLNLYKGRLVSTDQHLALSYPEVARTWPLGLYYLLGITFSFNIHQSTNYMRLAGAFWGILTIFAIYELARKTTSSKVVAPLAALTMGTHYIWVFLISQKGAIAQSLSTFLMVISLSLILDVVNQKKRAIFFLSFLLGGMWLYHPPTTAILLLPILVWYFISGRKLISSKKVVQAVVVFLSASSPYWLLLTPKSFEQRIVIPTLQPLMPVVSSFDYLFSHPFLDHGAGIIPIFFSVIAIMQFFRHKRHRNLSTSENRLYITEIILLLLLFEYLYYINPLSELRSVLSRTYEPERMVIHLAIPISLLAAYGLDSLIPRNLRQNKKIRLFLVFKSRKLSILTLNQTKVLLIASTLFLGQFCWGAWTYGNKWHGFELYHGRVTEDEWNMLMWIEKFTPERSRILIDQITGGEKADWTGGIHYYSSDVHTPVGERGLAWIALGMLVPRDILGSPDIFNQSQTEKNINELKDFYETNHIDYIIVTNSDKYPYVVNMMLKYVCHVEGAVLLYNTTSSNY